MKYDIAKNEDGPLRRTVKGLDGKEAKGKEKVGALTDDTASELQPAMDERLKNIESHVAVRYGNVSYFFPKLPPLMVGEKSPCTTTYLACAFAVPRRPYHTTRERISPMGGVTLQPT